MKRRIRVTFCGVFHKLVYHALCFRLVTFIKRKFVQWQLKWDFMIWLKKQSLMKSALFRTMITGLFLSTALMALKRNLRADYLSTVEEKCWENIADFHSTPLVKEKDLK